MEEKFSDHIEDQLSLSEISARGIDLLARHDPELYGLLQQEQRRQAESLMLVAASSCADPSVLACKGMATNNVTTEGYPGRRFHAGCTQVDQIERLAISRAKALFNARYANVQPHSGTSANLIVLTAFLRPGDKLLGMDLNAGGHLTHGAAASFSGCYYQAFTYGVDQNGFLDYDRIEHLAGKHQPKLIICGASSYPRAIDFKRFRAIADKVGAWLLADISHIAGLVATGFHQSPIDLAHITTTSTYKQLYGPRGGMILLGKDYKKPGPDGKTSLAKTIQKAVFPYFQGTPDLSAVAARARAFDQLLKPESTQLAYRIINGAQALAQTLTSCGYKVITGGTDNHMVLVDMTQAGMNGLIAQRALESCRIIINKNTIPNDLKPATLTSGIRLGTNTVTMRGMDAVPLKSCAHLIHKVLQAITLSGDRGFELNGEIKEQVIAQVSDLCAQYPIPDYPNIQQQLPAGV